jgi:hypothetical protein
MCYRCGASKNISLVNIQVFDKEELFKRVIFMLVKPHP